MGSEEQGLGYVEFECMYFPQGLGKQKLLAFAADEGLLASALALGSGLGLGLASGLGVESMSGL